MIAGLGFTHWLEPNTCCRAANVISFSSSSALHTRLPAGSSSSSKGEEWARGARGEGGEKKTMIASQERGAWHRDWTIRNLIVVGAAALGCWINLLFSSWLQPLPCSLGNLINSRARAFFFSADRWLYTLAGEGGETRKFVFRLFIRGSIFHLWRLYFLAINQKGIILLRIIELDNSLRGRYRGLDTQIPPRLS